MVAGGHGHEGSARLSEPWRTNSQTPYKSRRPVSTSECDSGCRLAVKRFALGPAGRHSGDGVAEHPLGGGCVGHRARRCREPSPSMLLEAAVAGGVVRCAVLPALPDDAAPGAAEGA